MKKILLIIAIVLCILQMVVLAISIDIGSPAIFRNSFWGEATLVNKNNPANASGKITSVELWCNTNLTNCEVATFYVVSGNNLSTRDSELIGTVTAGAKRTFSVDLDVEIGDYIGLYFSTGGAWGQTSVGDGTWYIENANHIPCTNITFGLYGPATISLYGTGITLEPDPPTNVQATDGIYTYKVTITWAKSDGATGYQVYRDGAALGWLGDVATYDDTGADAPTINHGSITASDGTSTAHVALSNTGASANAGTTHTYKVKAKNVAGESGYSGTNTGYRSVGALLYQWYRSNVDGSSGYGTIGGAQSSTYNDTAAPAGSVPGTPTGVSATDGAFTDKVVVTWTNVGGSAGAGRYYKCYHTATGAVAGYSPFNRGYRKAYTSTNTQVKRDAVELGAIGSLETTYNDTGADAPTITVGTASASDGTSSDHVTLSIAGESANVGTVHAYRTRTYNAAGWGNWGGPNNGNRGVGALTYQWHRSSGDADVDYSSIDGATTDPYNDTGAPENGDGRYFKCVENATGAAEQTTNADRGYRIAPVAINVIFFSTPY